MNGERITGLHDLRPGDIMFGPLRIADIGQLIIGEQLWRMPGVVWGGAGLLESA